MEAAGRNGAELRRYRTGTGLSLSPLHLWPRALATASDIDPVCVGVVEENAARNGVRMGARGGGAPCGSLPECYRCAGEAGLMT